jgi:hypothetical protein
LANYPDWILKHKPKGTYINRVGDKYYLYAAHSERIPGTKKVRRVSDGYLGRITEKDGLIPAKRKLFSDIFVYEFGLSETILRLCKQVHTGLKREFKANGDLVMTIGALLFMHSRATPELYETSSLSLRFPGLDLASPLTAKQRVGVERTQRMITTKMGACFGADVEAAIMLLPLVRKVRMAGEEKLAAVPMAVTVFCDKHKLNFEED